MNPMEKLMALLEPHNILRFSEAEILFRPVLDWELREEYFLIQKGPDCITIAFVDPEEDAPFHIERLFQFVYVGARDIVDVYIEQTENMGRHLWKYIAEIGRMANPYRNEEPCDYIVSKWIDRPTNVYLARTALEALENPKYVLKLARLIGPEAYNICRNLLAAEELLG